MRAKRTYGLVHDIARERAVEDVKTAPKGWMCVVQEPTRSLEQNAAMWPILECFEKQLQWPVNGQMTWLSAEEWKDILTCAFRKESARIAMGLDGGVVMLGHRTREFGKAEFTEWLEFLHATAALRGVNVKG